MSNTKADPIVDVLKSVLGTRSQPIPLHEPHFSGNEWTYVKDCLDSGWVSSVGQYVDTFEEKLAAFTGCKKAVAVVNGTAALHICLLLGAVKANDEVLVPSLTFVATANAIAYCQAIPHFVDCESSHLGLDVKKLRAYLQAIAEVQGDICVNKQTHRRIKAVVPVHIFGHPVDMASLKQLCEEYKLFLIEDATEALGSYYQGIHVGNFSDVACLSFNGNKIITTGGGGAVLTNNLDFAQRAKFLSTTAKRPHAHAFFHDEIGYNYRMPNINAALGCAQLEKMNDYIQKKRKIATIYQTVFGQNALARMVHEPPETVSNYWLNALVLHEPNRAVVEDIILKAQPYCGLRGLWAPMDSLPMYKDCPKMDLKNTYALYDSVVSLPSGPQLELKYG